MRRKPARSRTEVGKGPPAVYKLPDFTIVCKRAAPRDPGTQRRPPGFVGEPGAPSPAR
jgi:hypothetical protein